MENSMIDRHLIGDVGLAVLLAFPTLALARPQTPPPQHETAAAPMVEKAAIAEQTTAEKRFNFPR
jgi:hypothetical protein